MNEEIEVIKWDKILEPPDLSAITPRKKFPNLKEVTIVGYFNFPNFTQAQLTERQKIREENEEKILE